MFAIALRLILALHCTYSCRSSHDTLIPRRGLASTGIFQSTQFPTMSSNQPPYVFNPSCNSPLLPSFPFRPWYGEEPVSASDSNHEETPNPFLCAPRTTSHSSTRTLGMVLAKRDGRRPSYSRHPTITLHPDWPVHKLTHEYSELSHEHGLRCIPNSICNSLCNSLCNRQPPNSKLHRPLRHASLLDDTHDSSHLQPEHCSCHVPWGTVPAVRNPLQQRHDLLALHRR